MFVNQETELAKWIRNIISLGYGLILVNINNPFVNNVEIFF